MDSTIAENLAELGVEDNEQRNQDRSVMGSLWVFHRSNPPKKWTGFEEVAVLRVGSDWDVSGSARRVLPPPERLEAFFVILDGSLNSIRIDVANLTYLFQLNDPKIRVINSQPTGELLIRFMQSVDQGNGSMREGSYLLITD